MTKTRSDKAKSKKEPCPSPVPGTGATPSQNPPIATSEIWSLAAGLFGLGLLIAIGMFPALNAGFVWDDTVLLNSRAIGDDRNFLDIWLSPEAHWPEIHFWPVTYSSFWIENRLWGFEPLGFHVVNLILHFLITVLAWRILVRLEVPGAWFAAALFAIHPVHVEPAVWVISRKDLLSTLLYLCAAWLWIDIEFGSPKRRLIRLVSAVLIFMLAILSKTTATTLPAAMIILIWWKHGHIALASLLRVVPFVIAGLVVGGGETLYYQSGGDFDFDFGPADRVILAAKAVLFYLGKLVLPIEMAVIYPFFSIDAEQVINWLAPLAIVMIPVGLWIGQMKIGRGPLAAYLFFIVTLLPVLGFANSSFLLFSHVADRYQYLASLSVIALFAASGAVATRKWMPDRPYLVLPVCALMLAVLGLRSWQQALIYEDNIQFFEHVLELNPEARTANQNLGRSYFEQGQFEKALTHSLIAQDRLPGNYTPRIVAGFALMNLNRTVEALEHLEQAKQINEAETDPDVDRALNRIVSMATDHENQAPSKSQHSAVAFALRLLGRLEEASVEAQAAIEASGTQDEQLDALIIAGRIAFELGHHAQAAEYLEAAVMIADTPRALEYLGLVHFTEQRYADAALIYRNWADLEPGNAHAWSNLGVSQYQSEQYESALESFQRALAIDPEFLAAIDGLAATQIAIATFGRTDAAVSDE